MTNDETRDGLTDAENPPPIEGGFGVGDSVSAEGSPDGVAQPPAASPEGHGAAKHVPERRCILTGDRHPRAGLIRLALAPDGSVHPDIRARAPGRGAWIGVDRAALETAVAKGKLKSALARAFKGPVAVPPDLAERIAEGLARTVLDRLGLEARGGTLVTGTDRIAEQARKGNLHLLIHAGDAAEDGCRKLDQALRVGSDAEGSGTRGVKIPADRAILSMALGRENVVHVGIIAPAAAARVSDALDRWRRYIGWDDEARHTAVSQNTGSHDDKIEGFEGSR